MQLLKRPLFLVDSTHHLLRLAPSCSLVDQALLRRVCDGRAFCYPSQNLAFEIVYEDADDRRRRFQAAFYKLNVAAMMQA